jgi:hypothetical protein
VQGFVRQLSHKARIKGTSKSTGGAHALIHHVAHRKTRVKVHTASTRGQVQGGVVHAL